jgi:hypothetical protein
MSENQPPKPDPVLKFLELQWFPFASGCLRPPYDDLFLNREKDVETIKAAIRSGRNSAIAGEQGTGKSSLLYRVYAEMSSESYGKLIEFALSPDSARTRREFLYLVYRKLLELLRERPELAKSIGIDLDREWQRLGATLTVEKLLGRGTLKAAEVQAEVGGGWMQTVLNLFPKVGFTGRAERSTEEQETQRAELALHDEQSLTEGIHRICSSLPRPVVLYVDELDKTGRLDPPIENWDKELLRLLEFSRELIAHKQLTFVFTLQQELLDRLDSARAGEGDPSILGLVPVYRALGGFDDALAAQYVDHALRLAGWQRPVEEFCEPVTIRLIMGLTGGNPRLFANYLEVATFESALTQVRPISPDVLWETVGRAFKAQLKLDRTQWEALVAVAGSGTGLPEGAMPDKACKSLLRRKLVCKRGNHYFLAPRSRDKD